jgi:hypothetical protein
MARYYFDLHNGDGPIHDTQGIELASREDVLKEMSRLLIDLARDDLAFADRKIISLTVRSDTKAICVASLTFVNEWLD